MSRLQTLEALTRCVPIECKPFETWDNPKIKDWTAVYNVLTIGDAIEITRLLSDCAPLEAVYWNKVYTLAKCLESLGGVPIVTEEDLENYHKENNQTGTSKISLFDYKVILLKRLSEPVLQRLAAMYDIAQEQYTRSLFGEDLFNKVKATTPGEEDIIQELQSETAGQDPTN